MKKEKRRKKMRSSEPEEINEEPVAVEPILAEPELPELELPKLPGIEYNQPQSSPYEYPIATLKIGRKSYGIPVYYIQGIPHIRNEFDWNPIGSILLTDVDEDIGHTFVHFLYTGQYETLYSQCDRVREYRRSVLAYQAARTYGLPELETVAKKYIEHFSTKMPLEDILHTATDVFTKLPRDESYRENMHFFQQEEFTRSTGRCPPLDRTILQLTVDILSARIAELQNTIEQAKKLEPLPEKDFLPEPAPELETDIAPEMAPESESNTVTRASDFDAGFPAEYTEPADLGYTEEKVPVSVPEAIEEPEVCGLPEGTAESPPIEIDEPVPPFSPAEPPLETYRNGVISPRVPSPVEVDPVAKNAQEEFCSQEHPVAEPVPSNFNGSWYGSSSKKQKKKTKKKGSTVTLPPEPISWN
ncbi:hypothetical protein BDW67DRAFT_178696 [Aspergillus spinulosporus]